MQSHNPAMIEVSHYEVIDYKSNSLMHEIGRNVTLYYLQELSFSDKVSETGLESNLLPSHYLPPLYDHKLINHQSINSTIEKMPFHFHPKIVPINLLCVSDH